MERLRERLRVASSALDTLRIVLVDEPTDIVRDAAIQRFEYTVEATWKACQRYLNVVHGLVCGSPKGCIRSAREAGLLTDNETVAALAMVDDRNLTSHTYNEQLAVAMFGALPKHAELLGKWLERMQQGVGEG